MSFNKRKSSSLILFCIALLLLLPLSMTVYADKSLDINQVDIRAEILSDGTIWIQESRTFEFNGQHNGVFQNLRTDPGVYITDITVTENGVSYLYNPGTSYGPTGTYLTRFEPNNVHVDWSIDAYDETRTFLLSYYVHQQVRLHDDIGEIYYKFIGNETEVPQHNVKVRLLLPENSNAEDFRAWGHGPLDGEVRLIGSNEVVWEIDYLPPKTFLEGRVTFTPSIISNESLKTNQNALPKILSEEQKWADSANLKRTFSRFDWILAVIAFIGSVMNALWIRKHYGKPYQTNFDGDYYRELPAKYSPGELGVLIRKGQPNPTDFTATVIDLAYRGYLRLDEYVPEQKFSLFFLKRKSDKDFSATRLQKQDGLQPHEKSLLDFLFYEISKDHIHVTFEEIEKFAKKNPSSFKSFWSIWTDLLKNTAKSHHFFDDSNTRGVITGILTGFLTMIIGILLIIFSPVKITGALLTVSSVIVFILTATIHRRSPTGESDYVKWMAFKKFLLHFSEMEKHELPSLIIWEHYMIYAITLGVAKEVIKQLEIFFPNLTEDNRPFGYGWYYYNMSPSNSMDSLGNSFESLTSGISQSLTSALSKTSSGSGGGGGFSGGGGGGGGGGGVGSR
ncbi:MAG: DUF2207 domain-containing protein [Tissierellales bacterium]|nr:DUF2207 domain-containing protein [Tissierellales bacterium]